MFAFLRQKLSNVVPSGYYCVERVRENRDEKQRVVRIFHEGQKVAINQDGLHTYKYYSYARKPLLVSNCEARTIDDTTVIATIVVVFRVDNPELFHVWAPGTLPLLRVTVSGLFSGYAAQFTRQQLSQSLQHISSSIRHSAHHEALFGGVSIHSVIIAEVKVVTRLPKPKVDRPGETGARMIGVYDEYIRKVDQRTLDFLNRMAEAQSMPGLRE